MMAYVRDFSGIWGIKKYGMVFILSTPHFSLIFRQFSAIFPLFFLLFFWIRYASAAPVAEYRSFSADSVFFDFFSVP